MNILILTNCYPAPKRPTFGIFVGQQVEALRRLGVAMEVFIIRKWGPSVLGYTLSSIPLALKVIRDRPDVIHIHFGLAIVPLLPFLWVVRLLRIAVVVTFHGTDVLGPSRLVKSISIVGARRADVAIGVSKQICKALERVARNVVYLPCGIDTDFFGVPGVGPYRELVVFPSDPLRPEKNYARFVRIVGRAEQIVGRSLETVCLHKMSRSEVRSILSTARCLLMTSDYEGSPQIVKEAVVSGLPVLATDVGDVRYLVGDLPHCLVSDSDDELARAVADLVRTGARTVAPPSLKAQLDENQIAARLLDVYREAVDGRRPAHTS